MHLPGDKYHVHRTVAGRTTTDVNGPWDAWQDAKAVRDGSFFSWSDVQACWITKFNPSLGSASQVYGAVLKRRMKKAS